MGLGSFVGKPVMTRPPGFSLPPLPSILLILLSNKDGADSEPYKCAGPQFGNNADRRMIIESALKSTEDLRTIIGCPGMCAPYRPCDDELTE